MDVKITGQAEALIVAVRGSLDEHGASKFEASCREHLQDQSKAVIDLSETSEVKSAGVRALLRVAVTFGVSKVDVAVCPPATPDRLRFEQETGLDELAVVIRPTVHEALEALARPKTKWRQKEGDNEYQYEIVAERHLEFRRELLKKELVGDWQSWLATAALCWFTGTAIERPDFVAVPVAKAATDALAAFLKAARFKKVETLRRSLLPPKGSDPNDPFAEIRQRYKKAAASGHNWEAGGLGRLLAELEGEGPRSFSS